MRMKSLMTCCLSIEKAVIESQWRTVQSLEGHEHKGKAIAFKKYHADSDDQNFAPHASNRERTL